MNKNIKVGIFFVVGLLILLAVFDFVGDLPFLGGNYKLKTYFSSVDELRVGNPVKLEGFEVGKISKIRLADRKIEVEMVVKKDSGVKTDSLATIKLTTSSERAILTSLSEAPEALRRLRAPSFRVRSLRISTRYS
jgi:ABC-type transporter Mla subunit MlaD